MSPFFNARSAFLIRFSKLFVVENRRKEILQNIENPRVPLTTAFVPRQIRVEQVERQSLQVLQPPTREDFETQSFLV